MAALRPFRYERPASLGDLAALLAEHGTAVTRYLAGGTDLLPAMRGGKESPDVVIDLKGLPGIRGIRQVDGSRLWVGALTTIHVLETDPAIRGLACALFEGAQVLGSWQVRNRGTIGGNLANGAPTADTAAPLLALNAEILAWGPGGERRIGIDSFWVGAGKTILGPGEIITGVELPVDRESSSAYTKLGPRQAMDIAIASAAVAMKTEGGVIREVRISLGGAASTPLRAVAAEGYLTGRLADDETIAQAGRLAAADSDPRTSARASREYRLRVIPVLVERAARAALGRQKDLVIG